MEKLIILRYDEHEKAKLIGRLRAIRQPVSQALAELDNIRAWIGVALQELNTVSHVPEQFWSIYDDPDLFNDVRLHGSGVMSSFRIESVRPASQ